MEPPVRLTPVQLQWLLLVSLPVLSLASLSQGALTLNWAQLADNQSVSYRVLFELRLPNLLLTLIAGALLAMTGAAVQALFRNPLADPGLIGVTGGAAVGAVGLLVLGAGSLSATALAFGLPLVAFAGGLASTAIVLAIGRRVPGGSVTTLLLAGIAINAIAAAVIGGLKYFSDLLTLRQVSFWLLGRLQSVNWLELSILAALALIVMVGLLRQTRLLNLLLLGEQQAQLLGVEVRQLQRRLVILAALGVGAVVAFSGMIGFVGLVIPHWVRLLCGPDNRRLLPLSALMGAAFLTLADLLARTLVAPSQLPVGVVTALIGGPFFLLMIIYRRQGAGHA